VDSFSNMLDCIFLTLMPGKDATHHHACINDQAQAEDALRIDDREDSMYRRKADRSALLRAKMRVDQRTRSAYAFLNNGTFGIP
jgi:hypothetical protein